MLSGLDIPPFGIIEFKDTTKEVTTPHIIVYIYHSQVFELLCELMLSYKTVNNRDRLSSV